MKTTTGPTGATIMSATVNGSDINLFWIGPGAGLFLLFGDGPRASLVPIEGMRGYTARSMAEARELAADALVILAGIGRVQARAIAGVLPGKALAL